MSTIDDVNAAITELQTVVTELETPVTETVGDQVLAAIVPVLTSAGYTVTPPADEPSDEGEQVPVTTN